MTVYVEIMLFATLSRFTPVSASNYPVASGTTVKNLLNQLNIPEDEVKLVFVNGIQCDFKFVLKGDERIGIFPAIGGG